MKFLQLSPVLVLAMSMVSYRALADCAIAEASKKLDPVEVGFCESDAVFIGEVRQIVETMGGYTEEGSDRTKHFATQRTTMQVVERFKGAPPDTVTLLAQLYDKDRAYVFESHQKYLVFAKRLANDREYAGASEQCSVQPTLRIEKAQQALKQLREHTSGGKKIDCDHLRSREKR